MPPQCSCAKLTLMRYVELVALSLPLISQQQPFPYGGGGILSRVMATGCRMYPHFVPDGPEGGRSTGANGVVLCYIVKFDARNRKTVLLSR